MIALVHPLRSWGAVEEYVVAIARGLGGRATLVYPDDPQLAPFEELGVRTVRFPPELLDSAPRAARWLARLFRAQRPDVLHATDVFPPALVAARVARVPRIVLTHHTPELPRRDSPAGRFWLRLGWWMRPMVVYTSEADRVRDGRKPSTVIPLGIDVERFASGTAVLDGTIVGNVARLAEQKGHDTLLQAARALPAVRFVLVGDGELRAQLERSAPPNVEFLGHRADVPDLLASFAVFAYPSRFEGLCLAVIEAQAAGVPVVATPVGGIRETVVDGETGLLVPPDDPDALAEAIRRLLDDRALARRLVARAREQARNYSESRMVERTVALYDELIR